jgi:hypothetical protein
MIATSQQAVPAAYIQNSDHYVKKNNKNDIPYDVEEKLKSFYIELLFIFLQSLP